jgi:DNA-binding response OmpR family regulator
MATILIVEDEEQVRQLLKVTLTPEHQIVQAADAAHAIELARLTRPDLVLLDLNLQGRRDGLEVCRALRGEANPVLAQIPILMLTGETGEADIRAALAAGASGYIGKPYNPYSLSELITTLLARRNV